MATTLTQAQFDKLASGIKLMLAGSARELPFDAKVIEVVGEFTESIGFASRGRFQQMALDNPISTLLILALVLGMPDDMTLEAFVRATGATIPAGIVV